MTNLTEQWKKRTLKNGAYYIKLLGEEVLPAFCNTEYILKQFQTMNGIYDSAVAEVLAEVPSYGQWQAKLEENTKLKECLKRVSEYLSRNEYYRNKYCRDMLIEVDELLEQNND